MHPAELAELEAFREPGGAWRNIARAGFEPQYVRPNYLSGREDA